MSSKLVFEKQVCHYLFLAILLATVLVVFRLDEGFQRSELLGITTPLRFYITISIPVLHTLYVWFCWRT